VEVKNGNGGNGSKSWLLLASFLVAGSLGWVTGVKSDIDGHSRDIQGLKVKLDFLIDEIRELRAEIKKPR
jgi:hypothetical protein